MPSVPNPSDINASPAASDGSDDTIAAFHLGREFAAHCVDDETTELLARLSERLKSIPIAYELGIAEGMRRAHLEWAEREKQVYSDGYVDGLSARFDPPKA